MLKFHIIIRKFSNFTDKNSQSDTFSPKLKNTIVKIDIKSFSVYKSIDFNLLLKSKTVKNHFFECYKSSTQNQWNLTDITRETHWLADEFHCPCRKISWRWPAPDQTVWFPVLALTIRPGLGLAKTITFLYDQPHTYFFVMEY